MDGIVVLASILEGVFNPSALQDFSLKFLSVLFEGLPFIFIGTLISGLIDVYLPTNLMDKLLPKNRFLSILTCGTLGLIVPVCECTVVPVIRRLVAKGLPVGSAFAYMLAAPIVNPITLLSTFTAFSGSWEIALSRMLLGYLVAVFVGVLVVLLPLEQIFKKSVLARLSFSGKGHSAKPSAEGGEQETAHTEGSEEQTSMPQPSLCAHREPSQSCGHERKEDVQSCGHGHKEDGQSCGHGRKEDVQSCGHGHKEGEPGCGRHHHQDQCSHGDHAHAGGSGRNGEDKIIGAMRVAMRDFIDVTVYFVIGVSLVTLLKESISAEESWVADLAASGEVRASAFMMGLAFVLSLCSTSDAFVVATSFGEKFGRVSKMAFMVFGPMMDVKLLFLYQTLMRWRAVVIMAVVLFLLVGGTCLLWGKAYAFWMVKSAEMLR